MGRLRLVAAASAGVLVLVCVPGVSAQTAAGPTISSFSPPNGAVGSFVQLTGSGFSDTTTVTFAGTGAGFTIVDDAHLDAFVPFGALSGKIAVTNPSGTATSATAFRVKPSIGSFSPGWGIPGAPVTISGTAFTGATAVTFNGVAAPGFTVDSYTQITATVPNGATTGLIAVKTRGGIGKSATKFRVLIGGPGWPRFRYDNSHSNFNLEETILSPSNVAGLQVDWTRAELVPRSANRPVLVSPAVKNGILYATATDGTLYAFDAATGVRLWNTAAGIGVTSPTVVNGVVYVCDGVGRLYGLDATTGVVVFNVPVHAPSDAPTIGNGIVYVPSSDGTLYVFDATTGAPLWTATIGGPLQSPAVANGLVFVASLAGSLHAYNQVTGAPAWTVALGLSVGSPAVANGIVYFDAQDGNMHAVKASTGAPVWTASGAGSGYSYAPAIANGVVYTIGLFHKVIALNAATGATVWSRNEGTHAPFNPVAANGVLYINDFDFGTIEALDALTGTQLWTLQQPTGNGARSAPSVANGIVYSEFLQPHRKVTVVAYHLP